MQSWEWGEAREQMGLEVLRLVDGKNVFQLTIHPLPHLPWKIGYLPRTVVPTEKVLRHLTDYGEKNKIIFFKIEPYVEKSKIQIKNKKIIKSKHPLFPSWTQMLDITKREDELLKNCKSKTRYNIRLAQKKGVIIKEESNEKGFEIFLNLYFATCKRQKYYGHTPRYHQIIWNNLKEKIAHLVIAYCQNEPLAAYQLWKFKDRIYYVYGGSSEKHRNLMAANLLMWEAIKLGKKLGAATFDMWGSLSPNYDRNDPWAGFTRFKEGYGTEFVEMIGSYDLVVNPGLYRIYNLSHGLRNAYLQVRRLF